MKNSIVIGTGSYIPDEKILNDDFADMNFFADDFSPIHHEQHDIISKFQSITGIKERRYAPPELNTSDIGAIAAKMAIEDSGIDKETIDHLIVAHNFGNVSKNSSQSDAVPSLASRIKHALGIQNPQCIPYDVLFGCPGWVQGMIQAHLFFKGGMGNRALIVGTETLSRVIDRHDRDSMIFSDGAGACILEFQETDQESGILSFNVASHSVDQAYFIKMDESYNPDAADRTKFIKMKGRKVYEYAISHVPLAMKQCIEKAGLDIRDIKKIFIHQANEKMDEAIIKNLYKLYGQKPPCMSIMPMTIHWLGNSSVATIPTLFDLVLKNKISDQQLEKGDVILFASVGAGMNINAICYRI